MVAEEAVAERARIGNSWRAERAFRKRMQQEDLENAIITEILQEAAQVAKETEEPNARAPPEPHNLKEMCRRCDRTSAKVCQYPAQE